MSNDKQPVRQAVRDGQVKLRPGEYMGRNGEVLHRPKVRAGNKFDFPDEIKEPGWSYQWIRTNVLGDSSTSEIHSMKQTGWREVTPDQLKGYFKELIPEGQSYIEMDGLRLMERPEGMTKDAQRESLDEANRQLAKASLDKIRDGDWVNNMPSGVVPWRESMITQHDSYERAPSSWKPELKPRSMPMDE